jgi:predicted metal-dependent peptidase
MDFIGSMLQGIQIDYSGRIGTACIQYVCNKKQFLIELNPVFFRLLTLEERMGILLHELDHMTKLHLIRIPAFEDRQKKNKAADAVINQFVPGIPTRDPIRGIFPEDFGLDKNLSLEDYYDQWPDEPEEDGQNGEGDGDGGGGGQGNGKGKGQGQLLDEHDWDGNQDEGDILEGVEDLVKRTMIKTSREFNKLPSHLKDLLEHIEKRRKVIDWKKKMKQFMKKSATGFDKEPTRTRPNKRYDYQSPGLKIGEMPKLLILEDTSGSMSIVEVNAGLDQVDEILRAGARKVELGFWHTGLYHRMKYKKGSRDLAHKSVQSGGTCFEECAKYIEKLKPDAVIVFTDGYFLDTNTKVQCPILFVISHDGVRDLPTKYPKQQMIKLPPMGG